MRELSQCRRHHHAGKTSDPVVPAGGRAWRQWPASACAQPLVPPRPETSDRRERSPLAAQRFAQPRLGGGPRRSCPQRSGRTETALRAHQLKTFVANEEIDGLVVQRHREEELISLQSSGSLSLSDNFSSLCPQCL